MREKLPQGHFDWPADLEEQEALTALALDGPLAAPPASLKERLLHRIREPDVQAWRNWRVSAPAGRLHVVRKGEGAWQTVKEGIHVKELYVDEERDTITMLIRMDPGSRWIPHRHAGPEQCLVLEGDLREDGEVFEPGDYQCARQGSIHGAQYTENGCLILVVSSRHDELLT